MASTVSFGRHGWLADKPDWPTGRRHRLWWFATPSILVGRFQKFIEACTGLDVSWLEPPDLSVVIEEPGLEHKLEGNSGDLGRGMGRVSGGGVFHRIFDLNDQGFERLIAVTRSPEFLVIVLQSGGGNVSVCIV